MHQQSWVKLLVYNLRCFKPIWHVFFFLFLAVPLTVRKRGKESVSVTDSIWLCVVVQHCSHSVSTHCSSHNCRAQLSPPPPLPLSRLMPLIVQTWGLSRIACRLFTALPLPPSPHHHSPIPPPPPGTPNRHPAQKVEFKRPEHTACPVISHFKGSF